MLFVSLFLFFAFRELDVSFGRDCFREIFFLRRHDLANRGGEGTREIRRNYVP